MRVWCRFFFFAHFSSVICGIVVCGTGTWSQTLSGGYIWDSKSRNSSNNKIQATHKTSWQLCQCNITQTCNTGKAGLESKFLHVNGRCITYPLYYLTLPLQCLFFQVVMGRECFKWIRHNIPLSIRQATSLLKNSYLVVELLFSGTPRRWLQLLQDCAIWMLQYT